MNLRRKERWFGKLGFKMLYQICPVFSFTSVNDRRSSYWLFDKESHIWIVNIPEGGCGPMEWAISIFRNLGKNRRENINSIRYILLIVASSFVPLTTSSSFCHGSSLSNVDGFIK